jgi:hypothetical protein
LLPDKPIEPVRARAEIDYPIGGVFGPGIECGNSFEVGDAVAIEWGVDVTPTVDLGEHPLLNECSVKVTGSKCDETNWLHRIATLSPGSHS